MQRTSGFDERTGTSDVEPGNVISKPFDSMKAALQEPVITPEPVLPPSLTETPPPREAPEEAEGMSTGSEGLTSSAPAPAPSVAPISPGGLAAGIAGTGTGGFAHGPGQKTIPQGIPRTHTLPPTAAPALPPLFPSGPGTTENAPGSSLNPEPGYSPGASLGGTNMSGTVASSANPVVAPGTGAGTGASALTSQAVAVPNTSPDSGFLNPGR